MNKDLYLAFEDAEFWADFSFVDFPEEYLDLMAGKASQALASMNELERAPSQTRTSNEWSGTIGSGLRNGLRAKR